MQAFIFDMDGVIIDSEPIHNKVVKEVLLENNIVVDDEEFNKLIGMTSTSPILLINIIYHILLKK